MRTHTLVAILAVACVVSAFPTNLKYELNQEFEYQLHAKVDSRGQLDGGNRTSGSYSTMDSIVAAKVVKVNSDSYMFVMNMFDTVVSVAQGEEEAATVQSVKGQDGGSALGYDMYFQQALNGEVTQVWYQKGDSPYFVQVKLGAINAFNTQIQPVNSNTTAKESDPTGVHQSLFVGTVAPSGLYGADDMLLVSKTFNQVDYSAFMDKQVHASNVQFQGTGSVQVNSAGQVHSGALEHYAIIVDANPSSSEGVVGTNVRQDSDMTGFDLQMSSKGDLTVTFNSQVTNSTYFPTDALNEELNSILNDGAPNYYTGDMASASGQLQESLSTESKHTLVEVAQSDLDAMMDRIAKAPTVSKAIPSIRRLAKLLRSDPGKLFATVSDMLSAVQARVHDHNEHVHAKLYYLLSRVGTDHATRLFVEHGLRHYNPHVRLGAVHAARAFRPTFALLDGLHDAATMEHHSTGELSRTAYLVMGQMLSEVDADAERDLFVRGMQLLQQNLKQVIMSWEQVGKQEPLVYALQSVAALGELNLQQSQPLLFPLLSLTSLKFPERVRALAAVLLQRFDGQANGALLAGAALPSSPATVNPDFPFNKNFTKQVHVGGDKLYADFEAELFVGTNFDCNQTWFNYEALAQATAELTLWKVSKQALLAQAVYGRDNGSALADRIYLEVFGKVLYDKQLPEVDCQEHTYPIAHVAPGFDVSYTLWISVVPVTFQAGATLTLDLTWGWEVCDSDLSAMVELIPSASFAVHGSAEINLLIIKAGLDLDGNIDSALRPQAYIHGSECTVGFDLRWTSDPMDAEFYSYYITKKCKFWIFDCHWGENHQHTWWSWNQPAHDQVLYNKSWKIAKEE